MNIRTVPRAVIKTSLRTARTPLDAAARLLPGNGSSSRNTAQLAIDRIDAAALDLAGRVTLDPGLREDASRRRAALQEREQATRLRAEAQQRTSEAESRLETRREEADERRARADAQAAERRRQAAEQRKQRARRAAQAERQRKDASRKVEAKRNEQIEGEAPNGRLAVVEEKAEALAEREQALAEQDEAQRLAEAAASVKEARKQD